MSSAITIAAVGTGMSMYNGAQANKQAGKAMDSQQAMQQQQMDFQRQQYDRYLGMYGGLEKKQADMANSSQPLFYDQNAAAIKQNYANAGRNLTSQMAQRGMAGSGLDAAAMGGLAGRQASDLGLAYDRGMDARLRLGLGLTSQNRIGGAASGVANSMQGMSNMYGNQAGVFLQGARDSAQGVSQGLGNLGSAIGDYMKGINTPGTVNAGMPVDTDGQMGMRNYWENNGGPNAYPTARGEGSGFITPTNSPGPQAGLGNYLGGW